MIMNNVLEIISKVVVVEGKRSLGRPKRRWKNYIKMYLKEIC